MVLDGGGCSDMYFLSPMVLSDNPMYSSPHSNLMHLYLYITPLFLEDVPVLGCHREAFDGIYCPETELYTYLTTMLLTFSLRPMVWGTTIGMLLWLLLLLLVLLVLPLSLDRACVLLYLRPHLH